MTTNPTYFSFKGLFHALGLDADGWPCETLIGGRRCGKLSTTVRLSAEETASLGNAVARATTKRGTTTNSAGNFILRRRLGCVVCPEHESAAGR